MTQDDLNIEAGPIVQGLEYALKSFHVERPAYWSGPFIGNHVHRILKVTSII